jgi:hypothetical protein
MIGEVEQLSEYIFYLVSVTLNVEILLIRFFTVYLL